MRPKDAMMFPLIASCALFGLYILFHIFGKEHINMLLTSYFFILGIFALAHMVSPLLLKLIPSAVPMIPFHLKFTQGEGDDLEVVMDYNFNTHDLICLVASAGVGVWYLLKKHWIANDLLGMAFAVNGVELLHLNNVVTGCILLGGLFFYDIFWVFGTDVMVTVAKSFEAPIKLVFPQDLLEHPEDVVEEETAQQDAPSHYIAQMKKFHAIDCKGKTKQVVGDPVLLQDVPHTNTSRCNQTNQIMGVKVIIHDNLQIIALALGELQVEGNHGHS